MRVEPVSSARFWRTSRTACAKCVFIALCADHQNAFAHASLRVFHFTKRTDWLRAEEECRKRTEVPTAALPAVAPVIIMAPFRAQSTPRHFTGAADEQAKQETFLWREVEASAGACGLMGHRIKLEVREAESIAWSKLSSVNSRLDSFATIAQAEYAIGNRDATQRLGHTLKRMPFGQNTHPVRL